MIGTRLLDPRLDRNPGVLDHEIKFVVPASSAGPLCAWVAGVCPPERAHPPARVSTVYFDTPGLALLAEKIHSDYLKTKVRVRWYGAIDSRASAVFAEVKRRVGNRREKTRVRLDVEAAEIARWPLSDPRWVALMWPLRAAAPELPARLVPVLTLTYVRSRFVDPRCAARLTLDQHIATTAVNPGVATGHVPAWLDVAVFEYKGALFDVPPHLRPIVRFGARRHAFSKYLACYQAVTRLVL